jgi:hypothetical protein
MEWLASLCLGCWVITGLGLLVHVLDRAFYSLFNAKKFGEKPEKFEEE